MDIAILDACPGFKEDVLHAAQDRDESVEVVQGVDQQRNPVGDDRCGLHQAAAALAPQASRGPSYFEARSDHQVPPNPGILPKAKAGQKSESGTEKRKRDRSEKRKRDRSAIGNMGKQRSRLT